MADLGVAQESFETGLYLLPLFGDIFMVINSSTITLSIIYLPIYHVSMIHIFKSFNSLMFVEKKLKLTQSKLLY